MAAHALCRIAKEYLHADAPLCLWFAPTNAIVEQTLKNLQNRTHPCRRALDDAFDGNVNCIGIPEALRISKSNLEGQATVIVCTMQSFRVEDTEDRKVYDPNGYLISHFELLPEELKEEMETKDGYIIKSLANVIKLHRPIIISDEAHNSATWLSYETLARFSPSCVVEWTATPLTEKDQNPSNVISSAEAGELKLAGMIKFPIRMETSEDWRDNIRAAVARRDELEKDAKQLNGEYIRPMALYQAEDNRGTEERATVERVKAMLLEECGVPEEQIAVHTGSEKQVGTDVMSSDCPLRHIITVRALAEGWDCAFAYVLCTMANLRSSRAVEQVLGRILRLPGASRKNVDTLNECYAFAKGDVYEVARALKDALVNGAGFRERDARNSVTPSRNMQQNGDLFQDEEESVANAACRSLSPVSVPMLMARESGELFFLEAASFLDEQWSIADKTPNMSNFKPIGIDTGKFSVDISQKTNTIAFTPIERIRRQRALIMADGDWTLEQLTVWLDKNIEHPDIPKKHSSLFIYNALCQLSEKYKIEELVALRYDIKKDLTNKINVLRRERAIRGFQQMLSGISADNRRLEVSVEHAISFSPEYYAPHWTYNNGFALFKKHCFPEIGELKDDGEEFECAVLLENMDEVECWVRNLERRSNSFWLPTSSDKFYPDFICRLKDGRILVVEYKGAHLWSNDDSKEKRAIGEIWAQLSDGKCLFVMPKGKDWQAIQDCIVDKKAE